MKIEYTVPKVFSISIVEPKTSSTMKLTKKKKEKKRILRNNSEEPAHNEETCESTLKAVPYRSNSNNWGGNRQGRSTNITGLKENGRFIL